MVSYIHPRVGFNPQVAYCDIIPIGGYMLFLLLPWVLTLAALAFILVRGRKKEEGYDEFMDEEPREVSFSAAIYGNKAYWVLDNTFYESEVTHEPDFETARPIVVSNMPPKQLEYLMKVLDDLEKHEKEK
jgi:hypothetical protein